MKATFVDSMGKKLFSILTDTVPRKGEHVDLRSQVTERYRVVDVTYTREGFKLQCKLTLEQVA